MISDEDYEDLQKKYDNNQKEEIISWIKIGIGIIILFFILVIIMNSVNAETVEKQAEARIKNQQVTIILNSQDNFTFQVLPNQTFTVKNTYKTRFNLSNSSIKINITDKTNYTRIYHLFNDELNSQEQSLRAYLQNTVVPQTELLNHLRDNSTRDQNNLLECRSQNNQQNTELNEKNKQLNISQTAYKDTLKAKQELTYLNLGIIIGIFSILGLYITIINRSQIKHQKV